MYLEMYGFTEKPFHITPNPKFIFLSKNHKEAFAHLLYGIQQRVGFMSLSGEIGTGKTTVLRTLLQQLEEAEYRVALIFNPCLSALELLQVIHKEFGIDFDADNAKLVDLHDSLNRFLLQEREAGKTVVLVVDEAQNLDPKVLEQLRLLSNLETETEKLIQMVLVGQPELDEIFQRKDLRQLRQRLAVSYKLQSMDAEDTISYIKHRVKVAGRNSSALFGEQAFSIIFTKTKGTPRLINILCDRALLVAYGRDSEIVSKQDVLSAQKELRQHNELNTSNSNLPLVMTASVAVLVVIILFIVFLPEKRTSSELPTGAAINQDVPALTEEQAPVSQEVAVNISIGELSAEERKVLVNKVSAFTAEGSGLQSLMAIAEAWKITFPNSMNPVRGRSSLMRNLVGLGFKVVEVQGALSDIVAMNTPIIIEMSLPNVSGKRFTTITRIDEDNFLTEPAIVDTGWLSKKELKEIWFGKALLPYLDKSSVPLIDKPQTSSKAVAEVQKLLNKIPSVDVPVSAVYDQLTIDTITRFQRSKGLAPDGRVGAHTLFWLYRETESNMPRLDTGEVL